MEMLSVAVAACGEAAESFTCTVKLDVPTALGVPLIEPVLERVKPGGSVP
jgi:hypothetical protein